MTNYEVIYEIKPHASLHKLVAIGSENIVRIGSESELREYVKRLNLRLLAKQLDQSA